jgi:hypothetical protein
LDRPCRHVESDRWCRSKYSSIHIELRRHVDARSVHLAAEQFLRQRRPMVGGVPLGTDDGQGTVIAFLSQRLCRPHPRHAGAHDHNLL